DFNSLLVRGSRGRFPAFSVTLLARQLGEGMFPGRAALFRRMHARGIAATCTAHPRCRPRQEARDMTTTAAPKASCPRSPWRIAWASMVGTSLEQFDFYLYAYFAAFFVGPLFFEPLGAAGATLASFSTIAVSFVIRPVGAILFGHM